MTEIIDGDTEIVVIVQPQPEPTVTVPGPEPGSSVIVQGGFQGPRGDTGPQGPPGPQGETGDRGDPGEQPAEFDLVAVSSWTQSHPFAYPPRVSAFLGGVESVLVSATYPTTSTVHVQFPQPFTGKVVLS